MQQLAFSSFSPLKAAKLENGVEKGYDFFQLCVWISFYDVPIRNLEFRSSKAFVGICAAFGLCDKMLRSWHVLCGLYVDKVLSWEVNVFWWR